MSRPSTYGLRPKIVSHRVNGRQGQFPFSFSRIVYIRSVFWVPWPLTGRWSLPILYLGTTARYFPVSPSLSTGLNRSDKSSPRTSCHVLPRPSSNGPSSTAVVRRHLYYTMHAILAPSSLELLPILSKVGGEVPRGIIHLFLILDFCLFCRPTLWDRANPCLK